MTSEVRREIWTRIILYSKWDQIIIHYSYIRNGISPSLPMKEFSCAASNKRNTKVFQREKYRAAYNYILFAGKFQYWHDLVAVYFFVLPLLWFIFLFLIYFYFWFRFRFRDIYIWVFLFSFYHPLIAGDPSIHCSGRQFLSFQRS